MDILINVLKNLKGNDKFDGMQYLLVSINAIKIKWSPMVTQRAITLKRLDTPATSNHLNDQTLSSIFQNKKDNSKLIFNANSLNTLWIAKFFRRTLSEFVFESVNHSSPSIKRQLALTNNVEGNDENEIPSTSTSATTSNNDTVKESPAQNHQKRMKTKKKKPSSYKCVLCEKRSVQSMLWEC